jgi:hypothetical protein
MWANTKADFANFARTNPPANPLQQQQGVDEQGNPVWVNRPGLTYCWWAGSGKLMTAEGTYDGDGNELTPPTFLPGFVALVRVYGEFFDNQLIKLGDPDWVEDDQLEQWGRNRIAKYVKENGTPGTMGTLPYYEIDSVRLFRAADVFEWLRNNNLPHHEWLGGNSI